MKKTIKIMYFTDNTGKVSTREVSVKSIKLIIASAIALLLVSIGSSVISYKLYSHVNTYNEELAVVNLEKKSLEGRIKDLEIRKASIEKEFEKREEEIKTIARKETLAKEAEKKVTAIRKDNINKEIGKKAEAIRKDNINQETEKRAVNITISDFHIKKEPDNLSVSFDIVNSDGGETLSGYFLIVGDYGEKLVFLPEGSEVKDGLAVDFRKGKRFMVKWQKKVEQIFPSIENNSVKIISVLVYSESGSLLTKKEATL